MYCCFPYSRLVQFAEEYKYSFAKFYLEGVTKFNMITHYTGNWLFPFFLWSICCAVGRCVDGSNGLMAGAYLHRQKIYQQRDKLKILLFNSNIFYVCAVHWQRALHFGLHHATPRTWKVADKLFKFICALIFLLKMQKIQKINLALLLSYLVIKNLWDIFPPSWS